MSNHRTRGGIWKRLVSGVLCLALVLGLLPSGTVLPVHAASWAEPYAKQLVDWGVMRGDISGNLNLDRPITRAEYVTMINRAYGYDKLGGTPFTDVPSRQWYAQDIDIAYNAGYFKGTSSTTASPMSNLTREQAAVILSRNLMLRETTGESLGFSDSRGLSEWSRGLIASAVAEGVINGYSDGTFRPFNNITRGEVAAMLVRAIGTPIDKKGDHSLGDVYGNVTISSSDVNLRNTTIVGNLYLTGGIDLGNVLLENVTVLGRIIVSGAGESNASQSSVVLRNVEADEMVVDSIKNQFVTIRAEGNTDIPLTSVRTNAYLDDSSWAGYGLTRIEVDGESGLKVQLAGSIKEVVNVTPSSDLQLVQGSAEKVTIDEYAKNSSVLVDAGTRMDELNLDVATLVTGKGDIKNLNIGASGCDVDILPENVVIRPGITATIDGKEMGSLDASESSAEPKLMAGYPSVRNISPTGAEGVFSVNKPGTVYWAISAVADGSVSEEDLISPPSYGGNIFQKQSGQINASNARTEYQSIIASLNSDGSYYISAILVDGRGNRSPVKVASFSTPDSTVPAFLKYEKTKETTQTAQVTVMTNKNCQLYWALLSAGSAAPTPQEFKSGSISGNWGYGSVNAVKNVSMSINVNRVRLREKTEYVLYLWLTDYDGAQSMAAPVSLTFFTPDETPPIVAAPTQTEYGESTAGITFSINEVPSTLYWAVVPEGNETFIAPGTDMSDLRTKIKVTSGTGATSFGSMAAAGANVDTKFTVSNLITANTNTNNYTLYYVARDAAGNYSDEVRSISIRTLDTIPPTVKQEFDDAVDGAPRANTSIRLVFSENVKGGAREDALTFLELYQRVKDAESGTPSIGGGDTLASAREALRKALDEHIKMYSVPRNGRPVEVTQRIRDGQADWILDWRFAKVEMEGSSLVITLPTTGDPNTSALQLDSGATYYFHLEGVYDCGYPSPNGVMGNPLGNYDLPYFTTVYAQVELAQDTSCTYIEEDGSQYKGIRLDMCVEVKPESTKKVPLSEYWDMIMWSDTSMDIQVYRQAVKPDGTEGAWELLNQTPVPIEKNGIGMSTKLMTGRPSDRFKQVQTSLEEEYTYRYGIHIAQIGNIKETDPKGEPTEWGNLVTMRFSLVAGSLGDIQLVSSNVADNYDKLVNTEKTVSEIGIVYTSSGMQKILEYPKQFTDTRVPSFQNTYPQFTTGSGVITMRAGLNRAGKLYYVVAPVDSITTGIDANTLISRNNDGSSGTMPTGKTYVPISGTDREAHKDIIHFVTGGTGGTAGEYWSPTYRDIAINPQAQFGNNPDIKIGGPIEIGAEVRPISINGLKPETEYYIYVVLQGSGDPSHVVEIYRAKTKEITPPIIEMTSTTTTATMEPKDKTQPNDKDFVLYYALVESTSLPSIFTQLRTWTGESSQHDVIWAMTTRVRNDPTGKTYFDAYADDALKDEVMQYIIGPGSQFIGKQPVKRYPGTEQDKVEEDFDKPDLMTADSDTSEYMVLACARNTNSNEVGESFGFAAARGLYKPDPEPPEFTFTLGLEHPFAMVNLEGVYRTRADAQSNTNNLLNNGTKNWNQYDYAEYMNFYYTGTVTISFTKPLYQVAQGTGGSRDRIPVWGVKANDISATDGAVSIETLIGMSNVTYAGTESKKATQTFTLRFESFQGMSTILLPAQGQLGNSNPSSNPSKKRLTMIFDPSLTMAQMLGTEEFVKLPVSGFRVTWK